MTLAIGRLDCWLLLSMSLDPISHLLLRGRVRLLAGRKVARDGPSRPNQAARLPLILAEGFGEYK